MRSGSGVPKPSQVLTVGESLSSSNRVASRRRTGTRDWQLYTNREHPAELVEAFTLGSWREHLSQHESRHTGDDIALLALARARVHQGLIRAGAGVAYGRCRLT